MIEVDWHKCLGGVWCNLYRVDADHKNLKGFVGLYIIWSGKFENERNILAVGYGDVRKAIVQYKEDIAIKAFEHLGVFVTWADIPGNKRKNIHNFLIKKLSPKFTTKLEKGGEVEINLPIW
jgi:hypothetical protein